LSPEELKEYEDEFARLKEIYEKAFKYFESVSSYGNS
jgi:hypothetical protein